MESGKNKSGTTSHALLLLCGVLVISFFFIMPSFHFSGIPMMVTNDRSFTLSEDSPTYTYNIYAPIIGISSLQTNDTPVHIVVRDQNQVIFNATNIKGISDYYIEIPRSGLESNWWLEIVRQDSDVSVDITIHFWAIPVVMTPLRPIWAIPLGIGLALYALYLMFNTYRGITSDKMKGAKFLTIVLLLLIGSLFCYPLTKGAIGGDFTPVSTLTSLPDETYQFALNETHPNSSINLSLLYPEEASSVSFNIHSMISSEYPLQLSIIVDNTYNLTLEEESNAGDWWITIPTDANSTSIVSFERIDTDLDIEISVETEHRILVPRQDIAIPAIFGILGVSAIIIGIYFATRIDRYLADELANLGSFV